VTLDRSHAVGLAWAGTVVAALLLVWLSLGVSIIGADGDAANTLYLAVIGAGVLGTLIARGRPRGMAWTAGGMALLVAGIGLVVFSAVRRGRIAVVPGGRGRCEP